MCIRDRSTKSDEEIQRTNKALQNVHFRRAISFAADRGAYNAQQVGEDLKYTSLRNTFTPGYFVSLSKDTTIQINGTDTTFPAGTYYGEIVQKQIDACLLYTSLVGYSRRFFAFLCIITSASVSARKEKRRLLLWVAEL